MFWRHILGYLPVNAIQGAVAFGTIILFTRLLLPEEYGRYALVLATTQLVQMSCFTWVHAGMARFYETARGEGRLGEHFATGYAAVAVLCLLVGGAYVGAVEAAGLPAAVRSVMYFGLAVLLLRSVLMVGLETHRAARNVRLFGTLESVYSVIGLGVALVLILTTDLREAAPFVALAAAALVCLAFDLPAVVRIARPTTPSFPELKRFFAYGLPVSMSLALEFALAAADRYLIGWYLGEAAVGVYAASYALASRIVGIIFIWIAMAGLPLMIAALEREGRDAAVEVSRRNAEMIVLLAFPAAAGLAAIAAPLASVMVGAEFRASASTLVPWIVLAALMNGLMAHYVHNAFILSRRTDLMAWMAAPPTVLNVVLNILLIPRMGLPGAVIATVISYAVALVLATWVGRRFFPIPLIPGTVLRGAVAAGVMGAVVWAAPGEAGVLALLLKIAAGVVVYVPLALLLDVGGCRGMVAGLRARWAARGTG
ncbi:O-antigen/teichoic acid export membrane protein [Constrictibacter sp. MBR-5]|jgi:O-antigen/teichoic acid export membrane protein|uniref:lipopolysaccharide biosynthesis protein n=1 Tax=Constrictibacter sp. MBR-5 TaxID=3156467 RepID=UPI003395C790